MYYVTFIISNTYGKDVDLRTRLPVPFNKITIINGQTVRLSIKVSTRKDVGFQAFVSETGETITLNGEDVFPITPRESADEVTVLRLPEIIGELVALF